MDFRVLGPLEVRCAGAVVELGGPRQRAVLAALLLRANRVASVGYLAEAVWAEPPAAPESNLRTYVAGLRRCLAEPGHAFSRLLTRPGSYQLLVRPGEMDLDVFDALADDPDSAADEVTVGRLEQALALWRGEPLEGLDIGPRLRAELAGLVDRRIEVAQRYARAAAELGRHDQVVARLRDLVAAYPLREEVWAELVGALHGAGRRVDALKEYRRARAHFVAELGLEPGPRLRRLQQRILTDDVTGVTAASRGAYRQLPMEIVEFTDRDTELRALDALVDPAGRPARDGRSLVVVIEGMAGVGKTRLAIHAAHRFVRRGWCDGIQIWADLRGFDAHGRPAEPADLLDGFLRSLGVPGQQVPLDLDARAALYRSRLAGRRALVVLDNAATTEQVRPLLPGGEGALVLVTSRRSLTDLDGTVPFTLGVFEPDASVTLQTKIAGPGRIATDRESAERIAELCGHLPIAVCLAARRLRARPTWPLAELSRRLEARPDGGDRVGMDRRLRTIFGISYDALPPEPRRVFRLLGLHPGRVYTAHSVGALTGFTRAHAEMLLEHLLDEHLLQQTAPGRYVLHDLLRADASDRAQTDERAEDRRAATYRVLSWYLRTAFTAGQILDPHRPITLPADTLAEVTTSSGLVVEFSGYDAALTWCETDRDTLTDAVQVAAGQGLPRIAWQLANVLMSFFYLRSYWTDWISTHQIALDAARVAHDREGQATTLNHLGNAYDDVHRFDEALDCYQQARELMVELGDRRGQAWTLNNQAVSYIQLGRYQDAVTCLRPALPMFEDTADPHGQAICLANLADAHRELDQVTQSIACALRALDIQHRHGDRAGRRFTLQVLGDVYAQIGDHDRALDYYQECVDTCASVGDRLGVARAKRATAKVLDALGRQNAARSQLHEALAIFEQLGSPHADAVRAQLAEQR